MSTIVNMRDRPDLRRQLEGCAEHAGVVRIDRRTRWRNPYVLGRDGTREQVIARYRTDLWRCIRSGEIPLEDLASLSTKTLACWCRPSLPCHGDLLARARPQAGPVLDRGHFREAFPGIELRLRSAGRGEGLRLLEAGETDLHCGGLDAGGCLPDPLRREELPALTMGAVARRNHPLQAGGATAEVLADWPWIDCVADLGPGAEAPSLDDLLDRLHARTGAARRVRRAGRQPVCGFRFI